MSNEFKGNLAVKKVNDEDIKIFLEIVYFH
jgi:hypothetical protein